MQHEESTKIAEKSVLQNLRQMAREAFLELDRGEGIRMESLEEIDKFVNEILDEIRAERQRR